MTVVAYVLIAAVALLHVWIMVLEMFLWTTPLGRKAFGQSQQAAEASATLAANQGLYNGFLAAGLLWSLLTEGAVQRHFAIFFLVCVIVAGVYGSLTASRKILYVQALPGALALIATLVALG
jgi:putative membrane protein